jgi:hypothetical protein
MFGKGVWELMLKFGACCVSVVDSVMFEVGDFDSTGLESSRNSAILQQRISWMYNKS